MSGYRPLVVGNWKMNGTRAMARIWCVLRLDFLRMGQNGMRQGL